MQIDQSTLLGKENTSTINMRYVGMRDDEFTYDKCTYIESKFKNELINN